MEMEIEIFGYFLSVHAKQKQKLFSWPTTSFE